MNVVATATKNPYLIRGSEFTKSIFADWGNKEVADLLAGVDYVVKQGIADPARLGIGGWKYRKIKISCSA